MTPEKEALHRLRKENMRLRMEHDVGRYRAHSLMKKAGVFVKCRSSE